MTRRITRPSGTWEVLGEDVTCARMDDGIWYYWVCTYRVREDGYTGRPYSGVVRVPPQTAPEEQLVPELMEVVRVCREVWR